MARTKTKEADLQKSASETPVISATALADLRKQADKVADLEKAAKEAEKQLKAKEKQAEDLQKSLENAQSTLADIEKAKLEKEKADTLDIVKSLTFVEEGKGEELVECLVKAKDKLLIETLVKAQSIIEEFATDEHGNAHTTDQDFSKSEEQDEYIKAINDLMKSRKQGDK